MMSKITNDNLGEKLRSLGLTEKEARVYLALLEFGTQPASVIAKKTGFPRPTVLFLFDHLVREGYVRKSQRGRAQYFYADPKDLEGAVQERMSAQKKTLAEAIPLLQEFKNPFTASPRITFFEGIDGCKQAYRLLLESKTEIFEFASHHDLLRLGDAFMKEFIKERAKRKIFIHPICLRTPVHEAFKKLGKKEHRNLLMFGKEFGELYSSISIFDNHVLLLNLYGDAFAILIESPQVAQSLRTIHRLASAALR